MLYMAPAPSNNPQAPFLDYTPKKQHKKYNKEKIIFLVDKRKTEPYVHLLGSTSVPLVHYKNLINPF